MEDDKYYKIDLAHARSNIEEVNTWEQCQERCLQALWCRVWNWRDATHATEPLSCHLGATFLAEIPSETHVACIERECQACGKTGALLSVFACLMEM